MKTHRTNRIRTWLRPSVTTLEARSLLSSMSATPPSAPTAAGTDVLTYHNDNSRTGANLNETTLTPQNVNASDFGKLFRYTIDGYVYAQPLVVSQVRMGDGQLHNVLVVATENDSVYALDANDPTAGPRHNGVLWQDSFIDPAHGVTPVPFQDVEINDIQPVLGITGTPVIDRATDTVYVVTRVKSQPKGASGPHYVTEFHALDLRSGKEKDGGPTTVGDTTLNPDGSFTNKTPISVPGTGAGSDKGMIEFNALRENNRPSLALDTKVPGHPDGVVFAGFGSQGDFDSYHGWLVGFDAKTLKIVTVYNTDPNGGLGAIWWGGAAPSVASNGDLIFSTGNGTFDAFTTTTPPGAAAQGEPGFGLGYAGSSYTNVDLPATVGGGTAFVGFGGSTDGRHGTMALESWTYSSGGTTAINHSGGFASHGDLTASGTTTFSGAESDLTTTVGEQSANLFVNIPVSIQDFTTTFDFQMRTRPGSTAPLGDGLSFIIQNDAGHQAGPDRGQSIVRLSPTPGTMTVVDSFTPFDFKNRDNLDRDLGSTGVTLLPDFPGTAHPHLAVEADKGGFSA
jgi:hypothetical protein